MPQLIHQLLKTTEVCWECPRTTHFVSSVITTNTYPNTITTATSTSLPTAAKFTPPQKLPMRPPEGYEMAVQLLSSPSFMMRGPEAWYRRLLLLSNNDRQKRADTYSFSAPPAAQSVCVWTQSQSFPTKGVEEHLEVAKFPLNPSSAVTDNDQCLSCLQLVWRVTRGKTPASGP